MNDQKLENLLNLALSATEEERQKSQILDVGYSPETKKWDLIVKYSGELGQYASDEIDVTELSNEYAILTVPENFIEQVSNWPEVEYIEKPKRLYFQIQQGQQASCINLLKAPPWDLTGQGVIVAFIDSGLDYSHPEFLKADGSSRVLYLWDQSVSGNPPGKYRIGSEFTQNDINQTLKARAQALSVDLSGHGTGVASVAAGNTGVASQSDIIAVKLANPREDSFPRTTELMLAVDYVISKAVELGKPIVVNLSFGNTYGSHDGNSLIATYLDSMANYWKTSIVVGTGNEGAAAGHTSEVVRQNVPADIPFLVQQFENSLNIQIWKNYVDEMNLILMSPGGQQVGPFDEILGPQRFVLGRTELLVYYGEPSPYSQAQEIFVDFIPKEDYIDSGQWVFRLVPQRIVEGRVDLWMPGSAVLNPGTRFVYATPETTLTVPSTAAKVVSVGAYDSVNRIYADFSGRGYTRSTGQVKPDIVAPGVGIRLAAPGGGYTTLSGTSFATPFVSGSAALMMEYGIVRNQDPYLYGEKIKAYFIRGAKPLPFAIQYPNPTVGFGALCLKDSLPIE